MYMKKEIMFGILLVILVVIGVWFIVNYEHDDEHDHSVEIEGKDMKLLTVQEVAYLWEIDSEVLLSEIITEFDLEGKYTVNTVLEDIREEYAFSPALIKDMAEEIKQKGIANE